MTRQLYIDSDDVLLDFTSAAESVLGMTCNEYKATFSNNQFWARLRSTPDFFANLKPLPYAHDLWTQCASADPIVLTACPKGGWAEDQKRRAHKLHFNTERVITCIVEDGGPQKADYCKPGDILVDDWHKHREPWEAAGGTFILHIDLMTTLRALRNLSVI